MPKMNIREAMVQWLSMLPSEYVSSFKSHDTININENVSTE